MSGELHRPSRRAAVTLELILTLPILVIVILAIVEFGVLMANLQAVNMASRDGGRFAARSIALTPGTAADIRTAVDNRLRSAGLGPSASNGITLQHNVGGPTQNLINGSCTIPASPPLPSNSVRVRVCVPYERLAPNLLQTFGITLVGKNAEADATFDYEL